MSTFLPGFALIAELSEAADIPAPQVSLTLLGDESLGAYVPLLWTASGVAQITITGTDGSTIGPIPASEVAGIVYVGPVLAGTFTYTVAALDGSGQPVIVGGQALTASVTFTISGGGFSTAGFGLSPFGV